MQKKQHTNFAIFDTVYFHNLSVYSDIKCCETSTKPVAAIIYVTIATVYRAVPSPA